MGSLVVASSQFVKGGLAKLSELRSASLAGRDSLLVVRGVKEVCDRLFRFINRNSVPISGGLDHGVEHVLGVFNVMLELDVVGIFWSVHVAVLTVDGWILDLSERATMGVLVHVV